MLNENDANINNELNVFVSAFKSNRGRTPYEFISGKIKTGSQIDAIKHLFNIFSAEIAQQNNCEFFDFDNFYNTEAKE